ncbi:MAG TPA: hypothetical protein PK163_11060 [Steroidobacteraceae bacterium]|nr:hypothetical protein [Steroidobacteraceae bacterium]
MTKFTPYMAGAQSSLLLVLNPDAGQTPGITLALDTSPGAPPNTYTFDGVYDGNDDGTSETSLTGWVTYAGDPTSLQWSPATGHVDIDVNIPIGGHVYHAALDYQVTMTGVRLSGSGSFTNPVTSETTSISLPAGSPLVIKAVTVDSGLVANACGYNIDGTVPVQFSGPTGTLNSNWVFSPGSASVAVRQASFKDPAGKITTMADASTTLTCGDSGSTHDWEATYDQPWVCIPSEYGAARLTLTATDASTLTIDDEDPPGSGDISTYPATIIGSSVYAVHGFFDGGPAGNHYREHFTWTLNKDGTFSQWSTYVYTEGPNAGSGGICAARARR